MSRIGLVLAAGLVGGIMAMPQDAVANFGQASRLHGPAALEWPIDRSEVSHRRKHRRTIHITGVITNEGVECTALRSDDGRLYTLAGNIGGLKPGDRVRVIGRRAQASFCMQGITIEVRHIFAAR